MLALWVSGAVIGVLVISFAFFVVRRIRERRLLVKLFELRSLAIHLPQKFEKEEEKPDVLAEINRTSQLLGAFANLQIPFALETAVSNVGEDIVFYLAVPERAVAFATNQIHGLWPEAQIAAGHEYNIFQANGAASGAYLRQRENFILPIRTYEEAKLDTFAPILSNLANVELVGEGMAIQLLLRPASRSAKEKISKAIYAVKRGKKISEVLHESAIKKTKELLEPTTKMQKPGEIREAPIVDEEAVKGLTQKMAKPLFEVNMRLVTGAVSPFQADTLLQSLAGSFSQFAAPLRNEFKIIKPRNLKKFMFRYTMREFDGAEIMVLNSEEVASIFHLPSRTTNVPKIKWLKAKEAAPPTTLPTSGVLIGESNFRGERRPIYLADDDRRRHLYLIGQTGTGKSTFISNMVADDIARGKGVAIIDPHGDLIEGILAAVPKSRYEDVIVFDPGDREKPLGMNMLEYDFNKPEEKTFIVNELFNILDKLYDMKTVGGPMFEQYTKNATMLLMENMVNEPATLMEMPRVFTDPEFRNRKLGRITNPVVIDFWQKEAIKATGEHSLANMAPYITSKFNNFIANDYVRPIIGQPKSAFNFRKVMDEGKILLVNLSKGKIGEVNANLLGLVIVGKILMAALSRVEMPQEERKDFNLYIDEFQNFSTESIATILSEARKYRPNLVMAHQFIGQLTEKIRDAVFGNVGSLVVFRVGADDAEFLEKQFMPIFSKSDLINIDNRNAYVKLLVGGQTSQPFNLKTLAPKKGDLSVNETLKNLSRSKYGNDRTQVEADILARLRT